MKSAAPAAVVSAAALPMKRLKQRPLRKRPKHPKRPKRPLLKLRKLQFPKSRRLKLPIVRKAWRRLKQMKLPRAMLSMVRVAAAPAAAWDGGETALCAAAHADRAQRSVVGTLCQAVRRGGGGHAAGAACARAHRSACDHPLFRAHPSDGK